MLKRILSGLVLLCLAMQPAGANWCALPGRDGAVVVAGVVNAYFPGAAVANIGASSIRVGGARGGAQSIAIGDLLLVIQMQDATINTGTTNSYGDGITTGYASGYTGVRQSGRFEFVRAMSAIGPGGGTIQIRGATGAGLVNSYAYATAASTPRRTFQVIRVPQYTDATISGTVTAERWDGQTGGVVVLDAARRLTFAGGSINVAGRGFRGGGGRDLTGGTGSNTSFRIASTAIWGGSKGEGIYGTPRYLLGVDAFGASELVEYTVEGLTGGSYGRGAPANAGGGANDGSPGDNSGNPGGGGGGNGGPGGLGGHAWCASAPQGCAQLGGHPGSAVAEAGVDRLVMGGGGGAGSNNNETGTPAHGLSSSGGTGGGIVILRAGEMTGSGAIVADGDSANSTPSNDGSGGGGAGGSILLSSLRPPTALALSISARGGNGGSNDGGGTAHGPGGGGGGGFVAANFAVGADVTGGASGTTVNGGAFGPGYGAMGGNGGSGVVISGANIPGSSSGAECTPTFTKSFGRNPTSPGVPTPLLLTVTNNNPTTALTGVAMTDTYPAGLRNTSTPAPANSCSIATLGAPAGGGSFAVSAATVPAGQSCTYSVRTEVSDYLSRTNSVAAVTGSYNVAVSSLDGASATLTVAPPLTIAKWSQTTSDPSNGTSGAKAIPGAIIAYTIAVTNPAPYTVSANSIQIIDATPTGLALMLSTGPVAFQQGSPSSTLTFAYGGPGSTTDDVDFSSDGGTTWSYVPAGTGGIDPAVTHIRIRPKGEMAPGSSFNLILAYRVL